MRSAKKASVLLFTAAVVLVPAAAFTACDADDTAPGTATLLDGSATDARNTTDSKANDSGNASDAPTDSGNDVHQPNEDAGTDADAGADADAATGSDADAGNSDADADAGPTKPTSVDDGTYKITAWTCNGTKDVLAFANGAPGIGEIDLTVGATSKVDTLFSGGDCVRSNVVTVTYPEAGKVKTASSTTDTCAGTCTTEQCDVAATEPALEDTYDFTKTSTTFTGTRSFPAGRDATLAGQAGCAAGDTESVTYTKK